MNPMMGGFGMNPMDMNGNGIHDGAEVMMGRGMHPGMMGPGMHPGMMGPGMMNPGMMNPMMGGMGGMMNRCAPCFMCPMGTYDGGKCKKNLGQCGHNGFFGEMAE